MGRRDLVVAGASLWLGFVLTYAPGLAQAQQTDADTLLSQAVAFEQAADYASAAAIYHQYLLLREPQSAARRYARLKLPVLQEAAKHGIGPEMQIYLSAMDARAAGKPAQADALLKEMLESYAGSTLSDDGWYLRAYIALMDNYDYQRATELLQYLRVNYPDSRYIDTALFAEAITFEQLGDSEAAMARMAELRDRHTGISIGGKSWAKDQYVSRLWFERSTIRIEYLKERARLATHIISVDPYDRDGYLWQVELVANERNMILLLNKSGVLKNAVYKGNDQTNTDSSVNAYAGIVAGHPDSWARITIDNQNIRGMISVNEENHELLPVTTGGSLSDFHTLLLGDVDGNVSDQTDHVHLPPKSEDKLNNYLRSIKQTDINLTPGEVSQVAMIGVVIDSKYNDYYSGRGAEEALAILNTTDGIFREQLGIALMVDTVVVVDSSNDPMNLGSVTLESMMFNFKDYRLESPDLGSDIGLAILFSGNKNSDSALGLAWIGSACRTDGLDVSVVTPYKMPSLLSTHEIGHTLGADHDSNTSCNMQSGHVMWPFLSSVSGRTFSSCSQEAIARTMAQNNCHVDAMDLALTLENINADNLQISVTNQDTHRAAPDAVVKIQGPGVGTALTPGNCRQVSSDKLQCSLGTLTPMNTAQISVNLQNSLAESALIKVTVEGSGFFDVNTENNSFQTDINGSISSYSGPINSDPITMASAGFTSSTPVKSSANTDGAGSLNILNTMTLVLLLLARRKFIR